MLHKSTHPSVSEMASVEACRRFAKGDLGAIDRRAGKDLALALRTDDTGEIASREISFTVAGGT